MRVGRGCRPGARVVAYVPVTSTGRNVIAVIGVDHYQSWHVLDNAVSDARAVSALFGKLGFEEVIPPLFDGAATGQAIQSLVTDDLTTLSENDSLVLFYAGHGSTRTQRLGGEQIHRGYLVPVDGNHKVASWIELEDWTRRIATLPPRHILVILDACFSGRALRRIIRRGRDAGSVQQDALDDLHARRSRQLITSALDDQIALDAGPVRGHSLFTSVLLQGLGEGQVDSQLHNGSRMTTGFDLGHYLRRTMLAWPDIRRYGPVQTPDFGNLDYDDRGEMLIPLPQPQATHDAEVPAPAPLAVAAWEPVSAQMLAVAMAEMSSPVSALVPTPVSAPAAMVAELFPVEAGLVARDLVPPPRPTPRGNTLLRIPISRLGERSWQRRILLVAGIALLASIVLPVSLSPLKFAWMPRGMSAATERVLAAIFAGAVWPTITGGTYVIVARWLRTATVAERHTSERVFSCVAGFPIALLADLVGEDTAFVALCFSLLLGYPLLVFGLVGRLVQPQRQLPRTVTALGAVCLVPAWIIFTYLLVSDPPKAGLELVSLLCFVLTLTTGVLCGPIAYRSVRFASRAAGIVVGMPYVIVVLIMLSLAGSSSSDRSSTLTMICHICVTLTAYLCVLIATTAASPPSPRRG